MQTFHQGVLLRAQTLFLALIAALVLGTTGSVTAPAPAEAATAQTESRADKILRVARNQAGDAYRWGAAGPNAFDCSGFTQYVFRNAVGEPLPHSSRAQVDRTKRVSRADARRGDLVFFYDGGGVYHVAIYAGDNRVWQASQPGKPVHRGPIWTNKVFFGRVR